jgi:hypothetical protein
MNDEFSTLQKVVWRLLHLFVNNRYTVKREKTETLHTVLNMTKHYNRMLELELRLSEKLGKKTSEVPHVSIFIY